MRSPVTLTTTASVTEADLLVERLRGQGIDAVARTQLDRTAYAGLGGAVVLVDSDQRAEAELELMLLTSGTVVEGEHGFEGDESIDTGSRGRPDMAQRRWVLVCGYVVVAAMAVGAAVPVIAIIWHSATG